MECLTMGGIRRGWKSFLLDRLVGKKSPPKNAHTEKNKKLPSPDQVGNVDHGDGDHMQEGTTSPRVNNSGGYSATKLSRVASAGNYTSPLSRNSSNRRSKTPTHSGPLKLIRSLSRTDPAAEPRSLSRNASRRCQSTERTTTSRRSPSIIMYSNSNGLLKPPSMVKGLDCTLEDLCFGCIKKVKVTRDVLTSEGQVIQEDEELTIKVKPGWRKGTKITFEGIGNEITGTLPADVTFIVDEKEHPLFKRHGDELELEMELPLVDALTGCTISVPFLGGQQSCLTINEVVTPGYKKIIAGQGMTLPKDQFKRGNLTVKFSVQFPQQLTEEQRFEIYNILQESC